jgi:TRAP-type mannitol/chloroaromatic compound transport system permease small subunit
MEDRTIIALASLALFLLMFIIERIYNGWNHYVEHRWPGEHGEHDTDDGNDL